MFRFHKILSVALIVLTAFGTSGAWHAGGDDPDVPALVIHDHQAHNGQLQRAADPTTPTHCAICHWLQTFNADTVSTAGVSLADSGSQLVYATPVVVAGSLHLIALAPRAPPA